MAKSKTKEDAVSENASKTICTIQIVPTFIFYRYRTV